MEMLPTELKEKLSLAFYQKWHKVSPHYLDILAMVKIDWESFYFKLLPDDFVVFSANTMPLLDRDMFYIATSLNIFFRETDDCFDHPRRNLNIKRHLLNSLYAALDSRLDPYSSYAEYLLFFFNKIRCGFLRDALRREYKRYLDKVKKYMMETMDMDRVLMTDDFVQYRKAESYCSFVFLFLFLDVDDFRPYSVYLKSEVGARAWTLAIESCAIINDVLSWKKKRDAAWKFNYVISWMKGNRCTEGEAIDKLIVKARECLEEMVVIGERDLGSIGNDIVHRLILWVSGYVITSSQLSRYL